MRALIIEGLRDGLDDRFDRFVFPEPQYGPAGRPQSLCHGQIASPVPNAWHLSSLVLVAGFVDKLPTLPELDDFIGKGVGLDGLCERVATLTVLRSDNDPYVPIGHTDRLARLLGTSSQVIPGGVGHFLAEDGVVALPAALRAIH